MDLSSLYDKILENIKFLKPESQRDFWWTENTPLHLTIQVRALRDDLLQVRIHNTWYEKTDYIDGNFAKITDTLRVALEDMAGQSIPRFEQEQIMFDSSRVIE